MKKKTRKILQFFKLLPTYNEVSLFLFSSSVIIIFIASQKFRIEFLDFLFDGDLGFFVIGFSLGIFFALKYALDVKKTPTKFAKFFMVFFAMVIEFMIGVVFFVNYLDEPSKLSLTIGILSIVHVLLMLFLYRMGYINEKNISSYNAQHRELFFGVIFLLLVFVISRFVYLHESDLTFGLMISYSLLFDNLYQAFRKDPKKIKR